MLNSDQSILNTSKTISYFDSPIYKRIDANGQVKILYNNEALSNAFTMWLLSSKGDNLKSIAGGYLVQHIGKPMSLDRANAIKTSILIGLDTDFRPEITVVSLDVTPDYKNNRWVITLIGYNSDLNIGITSINRINN
jgi:hypothetical protein